MIFKGWITLRIIKNYKLLALLLFFTFIMDWHFVECAEFASEKLTSLNISNPSFISTPVKKVATLDCVISVEDGVNVMYTTASGTPCVFNVYDMDNNILLRSFELPGIASSSAHGKDVSGNIYIAGSSSAKLFCYNLITKTVEDLGSIDGQTAAYQLAFDGQGNLFTGTYPSGGVVRYNINSKTYTNYGESYSGHEYTRSVAYYNGNIYAGTAGSPRAYLVKINPITGIKTPIYVPSNLNYYTEVDSIYSMTLVNNYLIIYSGTHTSDGTKNNVWIVYDCATETWKNFIIPKAAGLYASPAKNGFTYVIANGKLKSINLNTFAVTDIVNYGTGSRQFWWANISNASYPTYGNNTLVTVNSTGKPIFANITQKSVKTIEATIQGGAISLQNLALGNNNKVYIGTYLGDVCVEYDIETEITRSFSMGQTEAIRAVNDKVYFGIYPSAELQVFDTTIPIGTGNPKKAFAIGNEQSRPYIIDSGDGMIFAGSVPDYSKLGGALSIYNETTGVLNVYRNVIQDQSIVGIAYKNGKIYGSTSVSGGLGIEPNQTEAKIFVWDVAQGRKIKEFIPEWPSEVPGPVKLIGDLEVGTDGLIWGAAQGFLFAMDPETCEFVKTKMVGPCNWSGDGHFWRPTYLRFSADGLLYTTQNGITIIDTDTLEYIDLKSKTNYNVNLMDIDNDGNIYYTKSADFYKINITKNTINPNVVIKNFGIYSDILCTLPLNELTANAYVYGKADLMFSSAVSNRDVQLILASYNKINSSNKLLVTSITSASIPESLNSKTVTTKLMLPSEITANTYIKAFLWLTNKLIPLEVPFKI